MDKKLPNKCYLSKVEIENFWGEEDISMDFNDDVNFIIGRNGAGKTTLINTIAAVLEGNYEFLSKLQFSKITITLSEANSPKKPVIEVEKGKKTSDEIIYTIKSKKSELSKDTIKIGFDGNIQYLIEDEEGNEKGKKRSSEDKDEIRNSSKHRMLMRRKNRFFTLREYHNLFKDNLFQLYDLCWLTIHRSPSRSSGRDKDYDSTVDQKLDELSTKCTKYFSKLSNSAAVEKEDFQKQLFLSLTKIYTEGKQLRALARVSEYKDERKDLETIYENFQIPEDDYKKNLDDYFTSYRKVVDKLEEKQSFSLNLENSSLLFSMQKIHETVEKWKETQIKESEIYKSRDVFLEVLNKMLLKKEVFVNNENVLEVKKSNGETFPINALSSGEKQLLILFGEALLQENRSFIFIADEPELSLHVDWQEQLVKNIRSINPKAQMIVATHSPDIISDYRDKAQDIESLLS